MCFSFFVLFNLSDQARSNPVGVLEDLGSDREIELGGTTNIHFNTSNWWDETWVKRFHSFQIQFCRVRTFVC